MTSPINVVIRRIVSAGGLEKLEAELVSMPVEELAALAYDWSRWARPNQRIPFDGTWKTWGLRQGRGTGKTRSTVSFAIEEIEAGRARRVALVGASEQGAIDVLVTGETGLLALSPPWLGATWESSTNTVRFSNGAIASVFSAESPATLRGPQFDLGLATEISSWPKAHAEEALSNLTLACRLGLGRIVWDSTPKAKSPLIRTMQALHERDSARHVIVAGATEENAINLAAGAVEEWRCQIDGTRKGREELDGEFIGADDDSLFKQAWIDQSRRPMPLSFARRVISVDPATTARARSDSTGIVDLGLGADGQIHALRDLSGKHRPETWPALVVGAYVAGDCDLVLVETNAGGHSWRALLTPAAAAVGLTLVEIGATETPRRRSGILNYKGIFSRNSKADRAQGVAAHVERGRVSFGAGLALLEQSLVDFDGRANRPDDRVDALTSGVVELAGAELGAVTARDPRSAFVGLAAATTAIDLPHATIRRGGMSLAELLGNRAGDSGI